ncbi:MAG: MepB family protein [Mycoplasmatales bacterium]
MEKKKRINVPYDSTDSMDRLIINIYQKYNIGKFIFNREILIKKILTHEEKLGKIAFRLYPIWSKTSVKTSYHNTKVATRLLCFTYRNKWKKSFENERTVKNLT